MYRQILKAQLKWYAGAGIVLGTLAAALLGNFVFSLLYEKIGYAASLLFIIYGCLIAFLLLDRYIKCFVYVTDGNVLRVSRKYGRKERFLSDIWFSNVTAWGTPEAMKKRFPGARTERAVKPQSRFEKLAVVYKDEGRNVIMILQPDDAMRTRLETGFKHKK